MRQRARALKRLSRAGKFKMSAPLLIESIPNECDRFLSRVDALSKHLHLTFFSHLVLSIFSLAVLSGLKDRQTFQPSDAPDLPVFSVPILGLEINAIDVYWIIPLIIFGSYTYFLVNYISYVNVLASAPKKLEGRLLIERVTPRALDSFLLAKRPDQILWNHPLRILRNFLLSLFIYFLAPLTLCTYWWRSMPSHQALVTFVAAIFLIFAFTASLIARSSVKKLIAQKSKPSRARPIFRRIGIFILCVLIFAISANRTIFGDWTRSVVFEFAMDKWEQGWEESREERYKNVDDEFGLLESNDWFLQYFARQDAEKVFWRAAGFFGLASPNLDQLGVETKDLDWLSYVGHYKDFFEDWCPEESDDIDACLEAYPYNYDKIAELFQDHDDSEFFWIMVRNGGPGGHAWSRVRADYLERYGYGEMGPRDFRAASMRRCFLPNTNLAGSDFSAADLTGCEFEGADLRNARFDGATLYDVNFRAADLRGAKFEGARISVVDFRESKLAGADFSGAMIKLTNFSGLDLAGANFSGLNLRGIRMNWSKLSDAIFEGVDLSKAKLHNGLFNRTNFRSADLREADLHDSQFIGADYSLADLRRADLSHSGFRQVDFTQSNMWEANLSHSVIQMSKMNYAYLQKLNAQNTRWGFDFGLNSNEIHSSILFYADFSGALGLRSEMFKDSIGNEQTILPVDNGNAETLHLPPCWPSDSPILQKVRNPWPALGMFRPLNEADELPKIECTRFPAGP